MNIKDLTFEYCQNKVFICKRKMDSLEVALNHKMKGKIVGISEPDDDDVVRVTIDTSDFVDYNNFYATKGYYDSNNNPCLTAREAGWWPENEKHEVYFMANDLVQEYFSEELDWA